MSSKSSTNSTYSDDREDSDYEESMTKSTKSTKSKATSKGGASKSTSKESSTVSTEDTSVEDISDKLQEISFRPPSFQVPPSSYQALLSFYSPLFQSPLQTQRMMFSPDSVASIGGKDDTIAIDLVLDQVKKMEEFSMDGRFEYPYIIHDNLSMPERNHGFEISLVSSITHRGFDRSAFHIRKIAI